MLEIPRIQSGPYREDRETTDMHKVLSGMRSAWHTDSAHSTEKDMVSSLWTELGRVSEEQTVDVCFQECIG